MLVTHTAIGMNQQLNPTTRKTLAVALLAISTSLCMPAALAAAQNGAPDASARYQAERAACLSGQTSEDRKTCLREAGAALQAARQGKLNDSSARYEQNALNRCNALPAADRQACISRMHGEGTTDGSVASGGIYRELVIVEPAPAGSAAPDAVGGSGTSGTGETSGSPQGEGTR